MVILVPILHCHLHFLTYTDPVPVPAHSGGIHPSATSPAHSGGIHPSTTCPAHSGSIRPSTTSSSSAHSDGIHPKTHVAIQDPDLLCKLADT